MRVNTGGKNGHFRVSAIVKWKTVDGNPWPLHLHIEGTAKPILATHPGLIQFTHDEVSARSTKELLVFNALDVDWSTLRVEFDPPYAKIIKTELHSDHAKLFLSPCPPSDSVDFSATLNVTANLADANRGVERCAISVPVQGTQSIDVQVSPRVVFANWSRELNKGTARFFLRGLRPEGGSAVSAVACDGFRAAWVAKDLSSAHESGYRTVQIELSLSEPEDPSFDSTQARRVRVGFERGPSVEVPVYLVAQQERS